MKNKKRDSEIYKHTDSNTEKNMTTNVTAKLWQRFTQDDSNIFTYATD